jgi:hypothetical protein
MGQSLPTHSAPVPTNVRYASNSDQIADMPGTTLSARSGHRNAKAAITDTGLLSIREIIERYE